MAYFELNIDTIIETYCKNKAVPELKCNGKCHLATQLALRSDAETSKDAMYNAIYEVFLPVYFQAYLNTYTLSSTPALNTAHWGYKEGKSNFTAHIIIPPPQYA